MVLRLATQEVKNGTVPEFLHKLPVVNKTLLDDVLVSVGVLVVVCFVADVEIEMIILVFLSLKLRS